MNHHADISAAQNVHRPYILFNTFPVCGAACAEILGINVKTLRKLRNWAVDNPVAPVDGRTVRVVGPTDPEHNADLMLHWVLGTTLSFY